MLKIGSIVVAWIDFILSDLLVEVFSQRIVKFV